MPKVSFRHVSALRRDADPLAERPAGRVVSVRRQVLGGEFSFEANSRALLRLVDIAYRNLPVHRFGRRLLPLDVSLRLVDTSAPFTSDAPPLLAMSSGAGLLCGMMGSAGFTVIAPQERRALVVASRQLLDHPYHLRYELIEFAVYLLAARTQHLIPLHAACVATADRAALLVGASGAGKSTLALNAVFGGFDLVSEDSVMIDPRSLRASGIASFLHVRTDSLGPIATSGYAGRIRKSPVIRRRSGVEKYEVDMRRLGVHLAASPPRIHAAVFMSAREARRGKLLTELATRETIARLRATQPYAVSQEGWQELERKLRGVRGFEMRRGEPSQQLRALRNLL